MKTLLVMLSAAAVVGCRTPPSLAEGESTGEHSHTEEPPAERTVDVVVRDHDVPLFEIVEVDLELQAGATVVTRFSSDGPIGWDVHTHSGSEVTVLLEGRSTGDTVEYTAEEHGMYSWLWINDALSTVDLRVELELPAGAVVHSWYPEDEAWDLMAAP